MKKNVLPFILVIFFPIHVISQSLTPSVISVQGGYDQSEGVVIEWTLGEIFIEPARPGDLLLTQGFHQPASKISKTEKSLNDFSVYPNPVNAMLNIEIHRDFNNQYTITLLDSHGVFLKVLNVSAKESGAHVDMSMMKPGVYLLNISNASGTIYKTYRIIKY